MAALTTSLSSAPSGIPTAAALDRRCSALYQRLAAEAREVPVNHLRPGLAVRLSGPSRFEFLPTASLGIQWRVPVSSSLHQSLCSLRDDFRAHCQTACQDAFWQPPATFHMNIAILVRLTCDPAAEAGYAEALDRAAPLLQGLARRDSFDVQFRGPLVTADGTILVRGYPKDLRPFEIRRAFMAAGFVDQQSIFHITVGRILRVLAPSEWRNLEWFARKQRNRQFGDSAVEEAVLIRERQGFLHSPACYDILAEYRWPSRHAKAQRMTALPLPAAAGAGTTLSI